MNDQGLREHLVYLLRGGGAHLDFEAAIAGLPVELRAASVAGVPHTPWRLLEHLRICQWDILRFCRDPQHISPDFPDGYWPDGDAAPDDLAWDRSAQSFREDRQAMVQLVENSKTGLLAKIPHGNGQTLLRETMLVADHNAYHLGQLVFLRRCLGAWND